MAVKIRLSRIGKKHIPFFRIVAVDERKKRDGAFLENLGTYDAVNSKLVQFHEERVNAWVAQGAIVTDAVKRLHRLHKNTPSANNEVTPVETKPVAVKKKSKKTAAAA